GGGSGGGGGGRGTDCSSGKTSAKPIANTGGKQSTPTMPGAVARAEDIPDFSSGRESETAAEKVKPTEVKAAVVTPGGDNKQNGGGGSSPQEEAGKERNGDATAGNGPIA
ncbi:unnamed protein product, partial [Laminaria digitata]